MIFFHFLGEIGVDIRRKITKNLRKIVPRSAKIQKIDVFKYAQQTSKHLKPPLKHGFR